MKDIDLQAFEKWWSAQETGLGTAHKFTAWNAWLARAAVEADRAQRVPDGWKLVPIEPTDAMVQQSMHLDLSYMPGHEGPDRVAVYRAMLSAVTLLASTPAPAQQSGRTEESGLVLDFASRVELSCYDQGSAECMAAVQQILDGKDRGDGVANEPWESIRRRLISLVAPAPAQQEPAWWRKRADEIEVAVARSGSTDAMRCYTDMRALLQAVAKHQEPPQQEREQPPPVHQEEEK